MELVVRGNPWPWLENDVQHLLFYCRLSDANIWRISKNWFISKMPTKTVQALVSCSGACDYLLTWRIVNNCNWSYVVCIRLAYIRGHGAQLYAPAPNPLGTSRIETTAPGGLSNLRLFLYLRLHLSRWRWFTALVLARDKVLTTQFQTWNRNEVSLYQRLFWSMFTNGMKC